MRMTIRAFTAVWFILGGASTASAQSSPVDLADLTLAELIAVDVIPDDEAQDVDRWHVDYNYVHAVFDGYIGEPLLRKHPPRPGEHRVWSPDHNHPKKY